MRDQVKKAVYIVQQFILAKKTIFGILAIQRVFLRVTNHSKNFVFRCDKNMRGVFRIVTWFGHRISTQKIKINMWEEKKKADSPLPSEYSVLSGCSVRGGSARIRIRSRRCHSNHLRGKCKSHVTANRSCHPGLN